MDIDNNFLTLSLSNDWGIGSPPLKGLPRPDGPPAVANGFVFLLLPPFHPIYSTKYTNIVTVTAISGIITKTSTSMAAYSPTNPLPTRLRSRFGSTT